MRIVPALSSLLVACALVGCPDREVSVVDPVQDKEEFKDIPVQLNRDIDILFMIDNSGSMEEEQVSLAANFPQFINVLETIEGGLPNVHLGVISSDTGAGPFNISNCSGNGDNGQLQTQARITGCTPPTGAYISDISDGAGGRTTNYGGGDLAATFSCIAQLGINGCGFEQQLESMRRALNGSNQFNNGFLRETAFLAVIFITDEDDCSTQDSQMFDTSQNSTSDPLGPLSSFRCYEFGIDCETGNADPRAPGPRTNCVPQEDSQYMYGVQEYVDFLKDVKGDDGLIIVAGIMGNREPVSVGVDPDRPQNPALVPSCTSAAGKADASVRLSWLLDQFPSRNAFTTICNEDLSDGLQLIAQLLKEAIGNPCIEALLKDIDLDTAGIQYECTVSDVVNPGTDDQVETVLPFCNAADQEDLDPTDPPSSTNLPCWHLAEDQASCCATPEQCTPTQLALVVERGGAGAPTGTHVQARCVTCVDGNMNGVCDELD